MTSDNVTPLREPVALPRLPPINIEAEQALLGAFLCNNRWLEAVADFLKPEHFASALHARILEAIQKLVDRGQIANVVTLKAIFDQDPALVENGGARSLVQLAAAGAQLLHFEDYARLVYDLWQRRQLLAMPRTYNGRPIAPSLTIPRQRRSSALKPSSINWPRTAMQALAFGRWLK